MNNYKLQAPYEPNGDQPEAIKKLVRGVNSGKEFQTLLGATGTGKTFTIANVIQQTGRPALVLAHNKTLAAQLCNELREFFPKNAVEYFISYYDYYQPEAYVPVSDTYIAKTASINEEIDMLRHSATRSLFERKDVIVVASISCIYGLGIPSEYLKAAVKFEVGKSINIPIMSASGLSQVTCPLAMSCGASAVGVGSAVNKLDDLVSMIAVVRGLKESLKNSIIGEKIS